ncbi:hypothetical protein F5888DRAFT_1638053 [Russula emetica]|nr:hypothetical protein F5888DRAFT_1638053 [Russula emetica]
MWAFNVAPGRARRTVPQPRERENDKESNCELSEQPLGEGARRDRTNKDKLLPQNATVSVNFFVYFSHLPVLLLMHVLEVCFALNIHTSLLYSESRILPTYILMNLNKGMVTLLPPFSTRFGVLRISSGLTLSPNFRPYLSLSTIHGGPNFEPGAGLFVRELHTEQIPAHSAATFRRIPGAMYSPSRARELRTQMAERRVSTNNATTKQIVYSHMAIAAQAVGQAVAGIAPTPPVSPLLAISSIAIASLAASISGPFNSQLAQSRVR